MIVVCLRWLVVCCINHFVRLLLLISSLQWRNVCVQRIIAGVQRTLLPWSDHCKLQYDRCLPATTFCQPATDHCSLIFHWVQPAMTHSSPAMNKKQLKFYCCKLASVRCKWAMSHFMPAMIHCYPAMTIAAQQWTIVSLQRLNASWNWPLSQQQRSNNSCNDWKNTLA